LEGVEGELKDVGVSKMVIRRVQSFLCSFMCLSSRAVESLPDSTEQGTVALLLQGLDGLLGQSDTVLLELIEASIKVDEREVQTQALGQSLEDLPSSRNDLTANAVTREQTCS
jgi:hypothetical protein